MKYRDDEELKVVLKKGNRKFPVRDKGFKKIFDESDETVLRKRGGKIKSMRTDSQKDFWIKDAIKKPGALHRELKVPMDKKIPMKKIEQAEHSKNPLLRKRAHLAATLKKMSRS